MTELQQIILDEMYESVHPDIQKMLLKGYIPDWVVIPYSICMTSIFSKKSLWLCTNNFDPRDKMDDKTARDSWGCIAKSRHIRTSEEYRNLLKHKNTIKEMAKKFAKGAKIIEVID